MQAKAIVFDLFDTVVRFSDRMPKLPVAGSERRSALSWLAEPAAQECPEIAFADLLAAVLEVSKEIMAELVPEYREVSSRERFRRALLRLGMDDERAIRSGTRLSAAHMAHIASLTYLPEGYGETLARLAQRYRLGLVSNFDDDATARRILEMHGVAGHFASILVSDGFGRRKPHPSIFTACLEELGVAPADAVFIGDSHRLDVVGARGVGMRVIWVTPEEGSGAAEPQPDARISELTELLGHFA